MAEPRPARDPVTTRVTTWRVRRRPWLVSSSPEDRVQRDVPVGAELADGHLEPPRAGPARHGVGLSL
jgi:hypothetical protein